MGRPTALTEERREQIEAKLAQGVALVVVAEETGVSAEYGDHEDVPAPGGHGLP